MQLLATPAAQLAGLLRTTFLPVGYPGSVAEEYIVYQTWDTVQAVRQLAPRDLALNYMIVELAKFD